MERRRLAVICSHLRPSPRRRSAEPPNLSAKLCTGDAAKSGGESRCVFCMIIRGESPAFKAFINNMKTYIRPFVLPLLSKMKLLNLYEDDTCLCILDSNPLSYGHSLIIPKLHFSSLEATPPLVVAAMCSKLPFLTNAIMKATESDSVNLLVNSGSAAGQVIFHTHLHIIPRKAGDQLWPSESHKRQPINKSQETLSLVNCIRGELSSIADCNYGAREPMLLKDLQA